MLSILITHYNRPHALIKCVESIHKLNLELPFEILVSDDGSTEKNLRLINNIKIDELIISKKNLGLTNNINKGLKKCRYPYLLYCQEDTIVLPDFKKILPNAIELLDSGKLHMIRLTANYIFPKLIKIKDDIYRIPKFSLRNFNLNTFQYSDNPFITRVDFYDKYGYYLEGVSGPYGETEYAIRLLNTDCKIGLTKNFCTEWQSEQISVMELRNTKKTRKGPRQLWRFARAVRQHIEWLFYNPKRRGLITYKNHRQS